MDPDQTAGMCMLVLIHAGRKPTMLVLSWRGSIISLVSENDMTEFQMEQLIYS
jgi:hypothetical protein